jgi:hypothetical protein
MLDSLAHGGMLKGGGGISRRTFVKGVALALAGGALVVIADRVPGIAWLSQQHPLDLRRSLFVGHLGETFQVARESASGVAVQLTHVGDLPTKAYQGASDNPSVDQEHCFSLLFRGPADRPLAQGTYRFEHSQFGSFSLFIVPMVPGQGGQGYEAIFNCPSV